MEISESIVARVPIVKEKPAKRIVKCCDERPTLHDSISLAKAETMAAPRPPLPIQSIVR
jgi:hypothetical protein